MGEQLVIGKREIAKYFPYAWSTFSRYKWQQLRKSGIIFTAKLGRPCSRHVYTHINLIQKFLMENPNF